VTKFNLADELRRGGGIDLLAEAVADIAHNVGVRNEADWLRVLRERASAQSPAPSALAEPRAVPGATGANQCVLDTRTQEERHANDLHEAAVRWGIAQSDLGNAIDQRDDAREALARVEAERDELRAEMAVREAEWKERLTPVAALEAELRNRGAVIEAARGYLGKRHGRGPLDAALSALDQAASEAEVTAEPTERIEYSKGRVAARRCLESAGAEVTERAIVVGSVWEHAYHRMRAVVTQLTGHDNSSAHIQWEDGERRVWPDWQLRAHFTWVSDPEATEREG
jgi:hypothetical protein